MINPKQIAVLQFMDRYQEIRLYFFRGGACRPSFSMWWTGMPKIPKPTFKALFRGGLIYAVDPSKSRQEFRITIEGKKAARWNKAHINFNNPESMKALNHMASTMQTLIYT